MEFTIRPFHPSDMPVLYRICLQNGDGGKDMTEEIQDLDLLGHIYAGPYAAFEPELCFILTMDGLPSGYVLGTKDTDAFNLRCEKEWLPVLRARYACPEASERSTPADLKRLIHNGFSCDPTLSAQYPGHLHIDLMAGARGKGWGRKLIQVFLNQLRLKNVSAVHLGVGGSNLGAIQFYKQVGFHVVQNQPWGIQFGMRLDSSP